ncbi:DUF3445 domain-containing protein [Sulfitobacter sp. S190]|uniref:heme-dependent oxidative N-demethylase family protein n=1 Tax=Sulfitobacter sp. S190 TaxID=2867022 RepID=UPI0021A44005|nr:DUF3445 domain-containing protein [Sulfitobacter sp. S190]UWR21306.1 DUF3445 domain-containing protein [Sulfitobacter sp. S190]
MTVILQKEIPPEMCGQTGLPGVAPAAADDWLRVDDAYAGQMAARADLLRTRRGDVLYLEEDARAAACEVLEAALAILPGLGFGIGADEAVCPDGRRVTLDRGDPLGTLGVLVQQDICLMQKRGDAHVLTGAVLCFPASWRLAEKAGRPLVTIHDPVPEYDAGLARRVQRLFDGVRVGRPLWRFNRLWYDDPALFQPRSAQEPRRIAPDSRAAPYIRSERQCIVRMPRTDVVVFSIHTFVVRG